VHGSIIYRGWVARFHVDEPPADKVGKVWAPLLGPAICILVSLYPGIPVSGPVSVCYLRQHVALLLPRTFSQEGKCLLCLTLRYFVAAFNRNPLPPIPRRSSRSPERRADYLHGSPNGNYPGTEATVLGRNHKKCPSHRFE